MRNLNIGKAAAVVAVARLLEQHRTGARELDRDRRDDEHRRQNEERDGGADDVNAALHHEPRVIGARGERDHGERRGLLEARAREPVLEDIGEIRRLHAHALADAERALHACVLRLDRQRDEHFVDRLLHEQALELRDSAEHADGRAVHRHGLGVDEAEADVLRVVARAHLAVGAARARAAAHDDEIAHGAGGPALGERVPNAANDERVERDRDEEEERGVEAEGAAHARGGEDERDEGAEEAGADDAQRLLFPAHDAANVVESEGAEERDPAVGEHHQEHDVLDGDAHLEELAESHELVVGEAHDHERRDERRDGNERIDGGVRAVQRGGGARVRGARGRGAGARACGRC